MKAVLLAGAVDFGRCPVASRLNRALWPVFGKPALQRTIDLLAVQGVRRFAVCCQGDSVEPIRGRMKLPAGTMVEFLNDPLPRGPAGCLRDAIDFAHDELLLVLSAAMVSPPDAQQLCTLHGQSDAWVSVFFNPQDDDATRFDSGIYICSPRAVQMIPEVGFMDIKEGLIRQLVRLGNPPRAISLPVDSGNFRTWEDYVAAIQKHLVRHANTGIDIDGYFYDSRRRLWFAENALIASSAVISGPAMIGEGSAVEEGAVLAGPLMIGRDVRISKESVIQESIVWDNAVVGPASHVEGSLVDAHTVVNAKRVHCGLASRPAKCRAAARAAPLANHGIRKGAAASAACLISNMPASYNPALAATVLLLLFWLLAYTYWHTLSDLWSVWLRSDEYSSGLLVPVVAGYIVWSRRSRFRQVCQPRPAFWGLAVLAAVQALRLFGLFYRYDSIERLSFVLSVGSLVVIVGGWCLFKKALPVFLFLFLMLPFPKQVEMQITAPLQRWATTSAVFCLETLGFRVSHEGNIIHINDTLVAVAEACNGLRMLTAFLVVSGMVVLLIQRRWWEKGLILLSSIPIALICNTARLTITAIFFTFLDTGRWEQVFHDFGGFAMMPAALFIIILELKILSILLVEPEPDRPGTLGSR